MNDARLIDDTVGGGGAVLMMSRMDTDGGDSTLSTDGSWTMSPQEADRIIKNQEDNEWKQEGSGK
ncbi:hypothetical protein ACXX9E_29340 [Pseudomonas sp. GNP014]